MPDADDQLDNPAAAAAPPAAGPTGAPAGPTGAPMLTPQKPAGNEASGRTKVQMGIKFLMMAAADFGYKGEDFSAILDATSKLTKRFGKTEDTDKATMPALLQQIMAQKSPAAMGGGAAPKPPMPAGAPVGA